MGRCPLKVRNAVGISTTFDRVVALSFVIPRACDFFDLFVFSAYPTSCISSPRQSRHPERSASQIYRKQRAFWRGVEGPRRCLLADALGSFPAANYNGR